MVDVVCFVYLVDMISIVQPDNQTD